MKQVIPFSKDIVFKTNIASITSISLEHEEKISDGEISGDFIIFGDYKIHNDTTEKELFKFKLPFTTLIPDNVIPNSISIDVENFTYETIEEDVLKVNINFSIEGEEQEPEPSRIEEEDIVTEVEEKEPAKQNEVENELNFFLDNKILSNLANIEELREKNNSESVEELQNIEEHVDVVDNQESIIEEQKIEEENKTEEIFKEGPVFRNVIKATPENIKDVNDYIEKVENTDEEKIAPRINETSVEKTEPSPTREKIIEEVKVKEEKISEETKTMISGQSTNSEYVTYHIHIVKTEETLDTIIKSYNSNLDTLSLYNDINNIKVGDKLIIPEYLDE